jgi:hypothetical protein
MFMMIFSFFSLMDITLYIAREGGWRDGWKKQQQNPITMADEEINPIRLGFLFRFCQRQCLGEKSRGDEKLHEKSFVRSRENGNQVDGEVLQR